MVEIKKEVCVGCGLCAKDCPAGNLTVKEGKAQVQGECMECGHCFAVCPVKAVDMPDYPAEGILEHPEHIDGETFLTLVKSRRSVRQYKEQPVEKEKLERILEAGRYTATAVNAQDIVYTIVQEELEQIKPMIWEGFEKGIDALGAQEEKGGHRVKRLKAMCLLHKRNPEFDPLFFKAPVLLVITSASRLSGSLAASNVELMAHAEGLGALYSGFIERAILHSEEAQKALGVKKEEICACLLLGYGDVSYQRSVPRKETKIQWK